MITLQLALVRRLIRPVLSLALAVSLSACSGGLFGTSLFGSEPSPDVKSLLINVASRHIGLIVLGDATAVAASVFPDGYFGHSGSRVTPREFEIEMATLKKLYPPIPAKHPLLGLKVESVRQWDNDALVVLRKDPTLLQPGESSPTIRITLIWTGSAWIVASDSLFGSGGLVPKLTSKSTSTG